VFITLNGEPHEIDQPLSVADLLASLSIDPRRVAVEHNLEILRRPAYADTLIHGGDRIEIVNFVGGGSSDTIATGTRHPEARRHRTIDARVPGLLMRQRSDIAATP
jgi:thiamine biosynthesis protein ThiS